MTGPEAKEILRLVFGAYPTQRARMQPEDVRAMLEVWSLGLADVDYDVAKIAVGRIVCTSKWLPSIAELRSEIGIVHHGEKRNGLEAWGDVLKLYNFRSGTDGVDPLVLQVCGAFGWIEHRTLWRNGEDVDQWHVVHGENEASDRARFAELYNKLTADERKAAQLSAGAQIPRLKGESGARGLGDIVKGMLPSGSGD
jgi:hypothetical protein